MQPSVSRQWFTDWFDSPYYHILYKNRDEQEAKFFIDKLIHFLPILPEDKILDLACGKGRHSIYLNRRGFDVIGVDLSEKNIRYAQQFANDRLSFFRHDKRQVFRHNYFTVLLNLFTSFGYFETENENIQTLKAAAANLKSQGRMVLDFMNTPRVIEQLQPLEYKEVEGICFEIRRQLKGKFLIKDIRFTDNHKQFHFQERLMVINQADFMRYFRAAKLQLVHLLGDYSLNAYTPTSERMIFILKKL